VNIALQVLLVFVLAVIVTTSDERLPAHRPHRPARVLLAPETLG